MTRAGAIAVSLLLAGIPMTAQEPTAPAPHLRGETADLRLLIRSAAVASPTLRALVNRIERSDLVVYVTLQPLPRDLDGRIGWLARHGSTRFLKIELACPRGPAALAAALAHELRHAVEIADAPEVNDVAGLERLYSAIGFGSGSYGQVTFETTAARSAGARVRREIATDPAARLLF